MASAPRAPSNRMCRNDTLFTGTAAHEYSFIIVNASLGGPRHGPAHLFVHPAFGPVRRSPSGAASRLAACEAFWFASKENIQTHGGMGFTWEVDCHLFYRRAKLLAVQLGAPKLWKEKLIGALQTKNAA